MLTKWSLNESINVVISSMYVSNLKQAERKQEEGDEKEDFSELIKCLEDVLINKRAE